MIWRPPVGTFLLPPADVVDGVQRELFPVFDTGLVVQRRAPTRSDVSAREPFGVRKNSVQMVFWHDWKHLEQEAFRLV